MIRGNGRAGPEVYRVRAAQMFVDQSLQIPILEYARDTLLVPA